MNRFDEIYDVQGLIADIPVFVKEIKQLIAPMGPEDLGHGETLYMIDAISPDWRGTYQPEDIVEVFGLDEDWRDEWIWEAIEEAEWDLTEQARDALDGALPAWLMVGFGHADYGGDYGLQLYYDEDGLDELVEEIYVVERANG